MKISEERQQKIYKAIADPLMDLRIEIEKYGSPQSEVLDQKLFYLESKIWRKLHQVLNLDGPA